MSDDKYGNLDFRLNLLYDYLHSSSDIYEFRNIIYDNIELKDIKLLTDYSQIFDDLTFIDMCNKSLLFVRNKPNSAFVRIGKYNMINKNINSLNRSEINEMKIAYILSELSKHDKKFYPILTPVMFFDITFDKLINKLTNTDNKMLKLITNKLDLNDTMTEDISKINLYVYVHENQKSITLTDFLDKNRNNYNAIKNIITQVLFSLLKIREYYPNFIHNNLDISAIFLEKDISNDEYLVFNYQNYEIKFESIGYRVKISNFYDSQIMDENVNAVLQELYDFNYFLSSIYNYLFIHHMHWDELILLIRDSIPKDVVKNIKELLHIEKNLYNNINFDFKNIHSIIFENIFFSKFIIIKNKMEIFVDSDKDINQNITAITDEHSLTESNSDKIKSNIIQKRSTGRKKNKSIIKLNKKSAPVKKSRSIKKSGSRKKPKGGGKYRKTIITGTRTVFVDDHPHHINPILSSNNKNTNNNFRENQKNKPDIDLNNNNNNSNNRLMNNIGNNKGNFYKQFFESMENTRSNNLSRINPRFNQNANFQGDSGMNNNGINNVPANNYDMNTYGANPYGNNSNNYVGNGNANANANMMGYDGGYGINNNTQNEVLKKLPSNYNGELPLWAEEQIYSPEMGNMNPTQMNNVMNKITGIPGNNNPTNIPSGIPNNISSNNMMNPNLYNQPQNYPINNPNNNPNNNANNNPNDPLINNPLINNPVNNSIGNFPEMNNNIDLDHINQFGGDRHTTKKNNLFFFKGRREKGNTRV